MGHPIISDKKYGGGENKVKGFLPEVSKELKSILHMFNRQALHAYSIEFVHPRTEESVKFISSLPDDFSEAIHILSKNMDNLFLDNIDSFLITLEKERNFSSHTIKAYKNDLNRFNLFLQQEINNIELKEINRNDIRKFLADEYENGYTSKTVARRLATLKSFFKYLVKVELIDNNVSIHVHSPKLPKTAEFC